MTSSSISTAEIEGIIESLKGQQHRGSTWKNYYSMWRTFNTFYIKFDFKPGNWEDRITLFVAHLIHHGRKSTTIRSYVSALKAVLVNVNISINEDKCLLSSLTRACKLRNDHVRLIFPIQKDMFNMILYTTEFHFMNEGQVYLVKLYKVLFSTAYDRLFRVGELTMSPPVVRVSDVHIGQNKKKMLFMLRSSKTHDEGNLPQTVKIVSNCISEKNRKGER